MEAPLWTLAVAGSVLIAVISVAVISARSHRRARQKPRVVEAPNSHYQSPGVLNLLDRERWESIRTDRLHELNREEVRALLARLKEEGIRSLSSSDRDFLDRMARVAGTHKPGPGGRRLGLGSPPVTPPHS